MSKSPIRFSTDILRRLGEELNPSIDQGILELVKNSYDANARTCVVRLNDVRQPGGTIEVVDDGDGMSVEDIVSGWLVLGRSRKSVSKPTRLDRIPSGNKGLGRLAAIRLGKKVHLLTRPHASDQQYAVTIDWENYSQHELVENVPIDIRSGGRGGSSQGTRIVVEDLRRPVGRMEVKRLARALILLADPFDRGPKSFKPTLVAKDFEDLEKLVDTMYFDDAEYHLQAELSNGKASAKVTDWRGQTLFEGNHDEIAASRNGQRYDSPDASFDLWVFILTKQGFESRTTSLREVRNWIESFGGVHLYLNGLRVAPYGNKGNDWLDINLRRVQSPEERPSTNTSIGRVTVEDTRGLLSQKTDRSGFIENEHYQEIQAFAKDSMEWMARRRLAVAELRRQRERTTSPTRSEKSRESLREQIAKAPASVKTDLSVALEKYDRERQREADALRREVQLYRTLSTAGITAATFAHESGGYPLKIIGQSINAIEFRGKADLGERYESRFADPVSSIRHACESLGVLSSATLQLIDADKRRMGRIDLHAVIRTVVATFKPLLEGRDVKLQLDLAPGSPFLRGAEASVESIVTNLVNNSLSAFESSEDPVRVLRIESDVAESTWTMSFSDNGPGIVGISVDDIWLPGNTSRPSGTGLGLTIVRDAVADLGGSAQVLAEGNLGGATFLVEIPILGVAS